MTIGEIADEYFGFLDFWEELKEDAWHNFWKRMAWLCRYGHIGYEDALRMPLVEANALGIALNELLEEESRKTAQPNDD